MSDWTDRISSEQAGKMLRTAIASDLVSADRAVVFHDLGRMRRRIARLRDAFPATALHALAIKANPLIEVLRAAVNEGMGLEAASLEEVYLAEAAGCPPEHVVFDSPAKTLAELEQALQMGVCVNADNFAELDRIDALLRDRGTTATIGLRVNPLVGQGTIATTSVAGRESKFGVPISDHAEILRAFGRYRWLTGLHAHVGSQGCEHERLIEAARRLADLTRDIDQIDGQRVEWLDIGGGLATVYRESDIGLPDIGAFAAQLRDRVPELYQPQLRVVTEYGRAIQAGCGVAFSRVEYVKPASTAVVHFGADLFLRWVYHPHDWSHELLAFDEHGNPKTSPQAATTIAGPLCFGGDILGHDVMLPQVEPGDWIGVRDVGAYTLGLWSRHCSRGMPLVLGYDGDRPPSLSILRPAETPADLVRFWSAGQDGHIASQREIASAPAKRS